MTLPPRRRRFPLMIPALAAIPLTPAYADLPAIAVHYALPSAPEMTKPGDMTRFVDTGDGGAEQTGSTTSDIAYGPADPALHAARTAPNPEDFRGFGRQIGAIKWEVAALFGYYTLSNSEKFFQHPVSPHFQKEGWFGRDTHNVGVDKMAHAYSGYVISEIAWGRLKRKTGGAPGTPLTAAAVGMGVMLYSEFFDSIEKSGGWSWEDVTFNTIGAAFSAVRNSVPGLDRKLDYRLMIVPNSQIFTREGKRHYEQQRYFLALKLAGFKAFENSPARFLELHAGYYGKDFTNEDRAAGIVPKRRVFVGVGVNLRELFFKDSKSRIGRAVGESLDYFQPPYTVLHRHITN